LNTKQKPQKELLQQQQKHNNSRKLRERERNDEEQKQQQQQQQQKKKEKKRRQRTELSCPHGIERRTVPAAYYRRKKTASTYCKVLDARRPA
jgi:hypothetical protein